MAWHRHKPKTEASQGTETTQAKKDEKELHLEAAFAKIKYPPPVETLVGTVIQAGSTAMSKPTPTASSMNTESEKSAQSAQQNKPVAQNPTMPSEHAITTPQTSHAASSVQPSEVASQRSAATEPTGPLSPGELHALGTFLKQKQQEKPPEASKSAKENTITPTNPDPEATIALQVAEKKKAEVALAAEEEEKKWHVTQANIIDHQVDTKKIYVGIAYWLGSLLAAVVLYFLSQTFRIDDANNLVQILIMTPIYLLALYGVAGWIPVMLLYMRNRKD